MHIFLSQTALEWSCLVFSRFLRPSDSLRVFNSRRDQSDRSDQNICHAHLFTVFERLNAECEFYDKGGICSVFVRFSNVYKQCVSDVIALRNPNFDKSVNLTFSHVLLCWSLLVCLPWRSKQAGNAFIVF